MIEEKLYPFDKIEPKWQKFWLDKKLFNVDTKNNKDKYYCLMMFPYPSAALHAGHGRNYIIGDAVARYKMMRGFNVLTPMGFDSLAFRVEQCEQVRFMSINGIKEDIGYRWPESDEVVCQNSQSDTVIASHLKMFNCGRDS